MKNEIHSIFPEIVHPLHYPNGESEESLLNYLQGFQLDGDESGELAGYLNEDFKRFVYTLNLLPQEKPGQSLLEIGSNPYFTSILLRKFTDYHLYLTNYFGEDAKSGKQIQRNKESGDIFEFDFINHNIDAEDIPLDVEFDVAIFCEVLEHLTNDPMQALLRIKKSLKQDGTLILTTPNVNRLENISRMISGANIYDPYSGYGPYGRHNREYNKHELFLLLSHLGFEIEEMYTSDVHTNNSNNYYPVDKFSNNVLGMSNRRLDLGQYIFLRAKNSSPAKSCKPNWLYRSYPQNELCGENF
jgi:SAM-dependent methyltransferase